MTGKDLVKYWLETSEEDFRAAETLYQAGRYQHSLFFCHLTLEKLLKGLIFKKKKEHAFPIHDLVKLTFQAGIKLTKEQQKQFKEINTWNIRARYDSYKREFYKKATAAFTKEWFREVKEIIKWLKNLY